MLRKVALVVAAMFAVAVPASALADDGHHDGEAAFGKVLSSNGRTLTITRADGRLVTGTVTRATEIECANANDDNDHGDDNGAMDNNPQRCDRSSLQPGTVVLEAKLRHRDNGVRRFRKLELAA